MDWFDIAYVAKFVVAMVVMLGGCGVIGYFLCPSEEEFKIWFSRTAPAMALTLILRDIVHLDFSNARDFGAFFLDLLKHTGFDLVLFGVICALSYILKPSEKQNYPLAVEPQENPPRLSN